MLAIRYSAPREKRGGLTGTLAWERIELAMKASNKDLARYLKRYLPEKEQKYLDILAESSS